MAEPPSEQLQNINIQGLDFDPFAPQAKQSQSNQDQHLDGISNGYPKHVSFDEQRDNYGDLSEAQQPSFEEGTGSGFYNTRGSSGDMSGFLPDIPGFQDSGQHEYVVDSEEEGMGNMEEGDLVDIGADPSQGQGDAADYAQTGQPLMPQMSLGAGQFSDPHGDNQQEQGYYQDYYQEGDQCSGNQQLPVYPSQYEDDNFDNDNSVPFEREGCSPGRGRRSLTPDRSLSPTETSSQAISMLSPDADSEPSESLGSETTDHHPRRSQQGIPTLSNRSQIPASPRPQRSGLPRPQASPRLPRAKKPLALPPWDDNVVIPIPPRPKSTLIGPQQDLPPRPRTAPTGYYRKETSGSSDSGVEEERSPSKGSADSRKRYGIDTKNDRYKPGGGNVKIFSEKVEPKIVGSRIDTKPRALTSPRLSRESSISSIKSPTFNKPPSPAVKNVHSKIGSMDNVKHTPRGGDIQVLDVKTTDYSQVTSKVGSKDKLHHKPAGGDKKVQTQKLQWNAESKVGSMKNAHHSPGGGNVQVSSTRLSWSSTSKVGSLDNAGHAPGGGKVKINHTKLNWTSTPRVGSLDNMRYTPGGGKVKVSTVNLNWTSRSKVGSLDNINYVPGGGHVKILDQKVEVKAQAKVGSTKNLTHKPGGGDKKIETVKLDFKETAAPKVRSLDKVKHQPGGGDIQVVNERLNWQAKSRIKSLNKVDHKPGGGNVQILDEKVSFTEEARSKVRSMEKVKHQPGGGDKKTGASQTDTGSEASVTKQSKTLSRKNSEKSVGKQSSNHSNPSSRNVSAKSRDTADNPDKGTGTVALSVEVCHLLFHKLCE